MRTFSPTNKLSITHWFRNQTYLLTFNVDRAPRTPPYIAFFPPVARPTTTSENVCIQQNLTKQLRGNISSVSSTLVLPTDTFDNNWRHYWPMYKSLEPLLVSTNSLKCPFVANSNLASIEAMISLDLLWAQPDQSNMQIPLRQINLSTWHVTRMFSNFNIIGRDYVPPTIGIDLNNWNVSAPSRLPEKNAIAINIAQFVPCHRRVMRFSAPHN